jgi:hypothetical protein
MNALPYIKGELDRGHIRLRRVLREELHQTLDGLGLSRGFVRQICLRPACARNLAACARSREAAERHDGLDQALFPGVQVYAQAD